jgi:hypothetical protein
MTQRERRERWYRRDAETSEARWQMDGGICQAEGCFSEGQVHHIDPKGAGGTTREYTVSEKVTLCHEHHAAIHDSGEEVLLKDFRTIGPRGEVDG